jgi:2-phosphosulfolactate phosphatase
MGGRVTIGLGPPCRRSFGADDAVIVVDVIRSTTTAITAVALGRRCFPAPSVAAARAVGLGLVHPLFAGELDGERAPGFDLNNSPAEVARLHDPARPLVLVSSSGTPLLDEVRNAGAVYLACLRNQRAVAHYVAGRHARIAIFGAATRGEFREEDQQCCARIAELLVNAGFAVEDRQTAACLERWSGAPPDAFLGSRSVAYLRASGQLADLEFILRHVDDLPSAFALRQGEVVALSPGAARAVHAVRGGA